jgi:hypothetical protein
MQSFLNYKFIKGINKANKIIIKNKIKLIKNNNCRMQMQIDFINENL